MESKLDKIQNLPYYIQIKNLLKEQINSGKISNQRLPSVRQAAKYFKVSANTVLRAFNELHKEGIVTGSIGRGTFLATSCQVNNTAREKIISELSSPENITHTNRKDYLLKIIQNSIENALAQDYSLKEYEEIVLEYIKEKTEQMNNIRLVFIECNIEQLIYFTNHLEIDPSITRIPILLEDIVRGKTETIEEIRNSDIIVTSFYHLDEVNKCLGDLHKTVIGINLEPEVSTIVEIAKVPADSVVGIVTTSKIFLEIIKEVLKDLKLAFKEIMESSAKSPELIEQIVDKCDVVLVSPRRKNIVAACAKEHTKIIEFVFAPDRTSVNNLKLVLFELKKRFT